MSSNQKSSTISSHQLNELVRLVVRAFVNETVALEAQFNNKNQTVPEGSIKLYKGVPKAEAINLAKMFFYITDYELDSDKVWNFYIKSRRTGLKIPCCKVGFYRQMPAILIRNGDGTEHLLVGSEILKDLDKDMGDPHTDKLPMSEIHIRLEEASDKIYLSSQVDEMTGTGAVGGFSAPMGIHRRKVKEGKINDPTREEMIDYLQHVYSGLLDRPTFDDAVEVAMYWFANFYHGGQNSNLYSVLSTSPYTPGRMESEPAADTIERDMFDALVREFGGKEQPISEGDEADAVNDMWSGSDDDLKGYDLGLKKKPNTKKSSKTPKRTGKVLVKGKVVSLKESTSPDYPFTDEQKRKIIQYFQKNQDVNFDAMALAMSDNLGQPVSSRQLYSIYMNSLMDSSSPINESFQRIQKIYKDRQGGQDIYWMDNRDTGGKTIIKPENINRYLRQGAEIVDLADAERVDEMTTTGDVSGYNVPSAFSKKGGSKRGVAGSAALGYTLTNIGQKEMERQSDKLLESKQPVRRQRCNKCKQLKPTDANGYIEGWECYDCKGSNIEEVVGEKPDYYTQLKMALDKARREKDVEAVVYYTTIMQGDVSANVSFERFKGSWAYDKWIKSPTVAQKIADKKAELSRYPYTI